MVGNVDAVILARDDWRERNIILDYFLSQRIPCFCDKPLTTSINNLYTYENFINNGLLYTGSGMRYAYELDAFRYEIKSSPFISAHIANDLERYGIHMLDALFSAKDSEPQCAKVLANGAFPIYELILKDGTIFRLTCSKLLASTFDFSFLSESNGFATISIKDNFTGFRRLLSSFIAMLNSGKNPDTRKTILSLEALCMLAEAGKSSNHSHQ